MAAIEDHDWKFTQCFGDKSDSGDVTDGMYKVLFEVPIAFWIELLCG
jgi:hypothetical protein